MESEQSEPLLDVDLLSVSPKIIRFRGLLSAQVPLGAVAFGFRGVVNNMVVLGCEEDLR